MEQSCTYLLEFYLRKPLQIFESSTIRTIFSDIQTFDYSSGLDSARSELYGVVLRIILFARDRYTLQSRSSASSSSKIRTSSVKKLLRVILLFVIFCAEHYDKMPIFLIILSIFLLTLHIIRIPSNLVLLPNLCNMKVVGRKGTKHQ